MPLKAFASPWPAWLMTSASAPPPPGRPCWPGWAPAGSAPARCGYDQVETGGVSSDAAPPVSPMPGAASASLPTCATICVLPRCVCAALSALVSWMRALESSPVRWARSALHTSAAVLCSGRAKGHDASVHLQTRAASTASNGANQWGNVAPSTGATTDEQRAARPCRSAAQPAHLSCTGSDSTCVSSVRPRCSSSSVAALSPAGPASACGVGEWIATCWTCRG